MSANRGLVLLACLALFLCSRSPAAAPPKSPVRLDRYGDPLPEGALARVGTVSRLDPGELRDMPTGRKWFTRAGHLGGISFVALSEDGRVLVTGCNYGKVCLWTPGSARPFVRLDEKMGYHLPVALTADGRTLATQGPNVVRFWPVAPGKALRVGSPREMSLPGWLSISANLQVLLTYTTGRWGDRGAITLHKASTRERIHRLVWNHGSVSWRRAALSPAGTLAAFAEGECLSGSPAIQLWEVATGRELPPVQVRARGEDLIVVAMTFSHDDQLLAVGWSDEAIELYRPRTGRLLHRLEGHKGPVRALAFSPCGRALGSGGEDGTVRLWEVSGGRERYRFVGHEGPVNALAFGEWGYTLASGSADWTVLLWDVWGTRTPHPDSRRAPSSGGALWADLAAPDAARAFAAARALLRDRAAGVRLLAARLAPAARPPRRLVQALLAELDGADYSTRETAARALERLGDLVEPELRRALAGRPSLEMHHRLRELLGKLDGAALSPEQMRALRAVEALEQMGGPEATMLLRALAEGAPGARLTREARASLARLAKRPPVAR
jgi:hypothetical protein